MISRNWEFDGVGIGLGLVLNYKEIGWVWRGNWGLGGGRVGMGF